MPRFPCVALILAVLASPGRLLAEDVPNWHMEYTPSHRASFEEEWKYRFPKVQSREWVIAIRYPPELAWSKDVEGKAQIFTSNGWKELKEVQEGSSERRKMFIIDLPHD